MRKLITFLLCIISASSFAQIVFVKKGNANEADRSFSNTRICLDCKPDIPEPLFILDGKISKLDTLKKKSDLQIDSVWILKRVKATSLYGSAGAAGVIIVKSKPFIQMQVFDQSDHNPIPNASVMFVSDHHRDTVMFMADSTGRVRVRGLKQNVEYSVAYTAAGYRPYQELITASVGTTKREILMERKYVEGENVIVTGESGTVIRCYGIRIQSSAAQKKDTVNNCVHFFKVPAIRPVGAGKFTASENNSSPRFYPNPLLRGQALHLELYATGNNTGVIRLMNASGIFVSMKQVVFTEGLNRFEFQAGDRLASGSYIVMVSDAHQKLIAQQKIIIQ